MKKILLYVTTAALFLLTGCELIQPQDIVNPNVDEDNYLNSYDAMAPWRNGLERDFATSISTFVELTELVSDNYFNNYTQSSKVFDIPQIEYHDLDVTNLQRLVAKLRESANYGINKIAPADPRTKQEDLFSLRFIRAYSFLLAGEFFTGLPMEELGEVKDWQTNLNQAITEFKSLLSKTDDPEEKAALNLLVARAYYRLGDKTNAVSHATSALSASGNFTKTVRFDGNQGVNNSAQTWMYGTAFQPLPRLDFLDPKYFQTVAKEQRPIMIAKAEEGYLIQAEAQISDSQITEAKTTLKNLLALINSRPVLTVNDENETRGIGFYVLYPNSSDYKVAASPDELFREGLVLDRGKEHPMVDIPYISGTSVTQEMIDQSAGENELLELCYLMRQEVFFAEGRRMCDLGIRFPVCFKEEAVNPTTAGYTTAVIPGFIPLNQGMDAFTMDTAAKTVVIEYNMNRVIVNNKNTAYVVPFIR